MNPSPLIVYCGCVTVLWFKFVTAILIQARERRRTLRFRYDEDARAFQGSVGADTELCSRAQSVLRNDSESQPYFLLLGLLYVLMDGSTLGALFYFPSYALSRLGHAFFLLRGRQPIRTRVFGLGVLITTTLALHVFSILVGAAVRGEAMAGAREDIRGDRTSASLTTSPSNQPGLTTRLPTDGDHTSQ